MYGRRKPPIAKVREVGSKKRKLPWSMISIGNIESKTATGSRGAEEDKIREAKNKEVGIEVSI